MPAPQLRDCRDNSTCRSCPAQVLWTIADPGGKRMPVDAAPSDQGQFVLNYRKRENKLLSVHISRVSADALVGRNRYTSHFETCPAADKHRKAR